MQVLARVIYPRLIYYSWDGEFVPSSSSISKAMQDLKDVHLDFVRVSEGLR